MHIAASRPFLRRHIGVPSPPEWGEFWPLDAYAVVPRISAFYGIGIWMYHDEAHHLGRPHFHARYGDDEASIDIESFALIAGGLPPRARRLVVEWARAHQVELRENWDRARSHQPLRPIEPLS